MPQWHRILKNTFRDNKKFDIRVNVLKNIFKEDKICSQRFIYVLIYNKMNESIRIEHNNVIKYIDYNLVILPLNNNNNNNIIYLRNI